jgi:hypothetical protein
MAMEADLLGPFSPPAAGVAGFEGGCEAFNASIHWRNVLVTACWSSRAVGDVKVKV